MKDSLLKEYSALAELYDKKWSSYTEATVTETLKRASIKGTDTILDLGCGTGELLLKLSDRYPEANLYGIDPVTEMLDISRSKLKGSVNLKSGWSDNLPFPDGYFETAIICSVFHFIDEPEKSLCEINRILKENGKLIITDWCGDFITTRLVTYYLKAINKAHFKTYSLNELSELLTENRFSTVLKEKYKIDRIWGMMTLVSKKIV